MGQKPCKGTKKTNKQSWSIHGAQSCPVDAPGLFLFFWYPYRASGLRDCFFVFLYPLRGFASRAQKQPCKGTKKNKKNNPVNQKPCKGTKKQQKQSWSIYGTQSCPIDAPGLFFCFFGTLTRFLAYRIVFFGLFGTLTAFLLL